MKPNSTEYSQDELQRLPQTTTIFNQPSLVMEHHEWVQQGYEITDNCNPKRHDCHPGGIPIPTGQTLIKQGGKYDLVPEGSR